MSSSNSAFLRSGDQRPPTRTTSRRCSGVCHPTGDQGFAVALQSELLGDRDAWNPGDTTLHDEQRDPVPFFAWGFAIDQQILQSPHSRGAQGTETVSRSAVSHFQMSGRRSSRKPERGTVLLAAVHPVLDGAHLEAHSPPELGNLHLSRHGDSIREGGPRLRRRRRGAFELQPAVRTDSLAKSQITRPARRALLAKLPQQLELRLR